jgi:hypothetical protein
MDNLTKATHYTNNIVAAIKGFKVPSALYAIVRPDFPESYMDIAIGDLGEILFFGYEDQCIRANNFRFTGKIIQLLTHWI